MTWAQIGTLLGGLTGVAVFFWAVISSFMNKLNEIKNEVTKIHEKTKGQEKRIDRIETKLNSVPKTCPYWKDGK